MGGVVTAYYIFARTTEYDFKFLELGVIANLFFLIFLLKDRGPQKVEDSISFVRFSGGKLKFSEVSVSIYKVQKIALEVVGEDCYFTLPYNQTEPGESPGFVFPVGKLEEFKKYLLAGLGPVEIIT